MRDHVDPSIRLLPNTRMSNTCNLEVFNET